MPEIKNTFLKAKMNKDLDDRLVPNGEYRDAQNLQISRSEGSSVGEFENIPGNTALADMMLGSGGVSIGQYTDETNGNIYIFSAGYSGTAVCPRDITVYSNGLQAATTLVFKDKTGMSGTVINPQTLGIEVGMLLWTNGTWGGNPPTIAPVVTSVTSGNIVVDTQTQLSDNDAVTIGFVNTIHKYNISDASLSLLVKGSFLNFHKDYKINGVNLLEDLLFWTDNRNQPRRINVESAVNNGITYYTQEDQISVAKYYPYETPIVLEQKITTGSAGTYPATPTIRGYEVELAADPNVLGVKVGDIVTGFPGQGPQELWEVIWIEASGGNDSIVVYNNFYNTPGTAGASWGGGSLLTFSRPTMENSKDIYNINGFETDVLASSYPAPPTTVAAGAAFSIDYIYSNSAGTAGAQYTPNVGDLITSDNLTDPLQLASSSAAITIADDVRIQSIDTITPGTSMVIKLTKAVKVVTSNDSLRISANPSYDSTFTGDPDFLEERFVRFSYRFKYIDNEHSLSAPFTQICFIPKQNGIFGGGLTTSNQDMVSTYESTVVTFMENSIDTIGLKIPLPLGGGSAADAVTSLINDYHISDIEILYKEADGLAIKVVDSIPVNDTLVSSVTALPSTSTTEWYYNFTYKSSKPYQTLPTSQNTRVYDKVPIKALSQEVVSNRITYGNYLEGHTPPAGLDYEIILADKSLAYDNYSQYPNHSIKQNRNYQVGFILADRYGRQSSVILSSNDADPNTAGSTIYVPYKSYADVNIEDGLSTYEWLGSALRLKLNNGITQVTSNNVTGEPGLYKAYEDTSVDKVTLTTAGSGVTAGTYATAYPSGSVGQGTGLTVTVTVATGAVTSVVIATPGSGYVNGEVLEISNGTSKPTITLTVYEPNPLGWNSYKIAVKQQEQEYYNAYLPGFVSGYPVTGTTDKGRIAFATVIGDNVNKIPRDLNEVGPLQTEFTASVNLYGRVNNPTINNRNVPVGAYYSNRAIPWNTQYFPGRLSDEVTVIGPAGENGLELANSPFTAGATQGFFTNSADTNLGAVAAQIPWGIAGADQSFYLQEQNPLILGLKVGRLTPQPQLTTGIGGAANTLGALVSGNPVSGASSNVLCMNPYLSVSETEPVESLLELFWETSTSGDFVALNDQVVADYSGVSLVSDSSGSFNEDDASATVVINNLKFQDSAGNALTLDADPIITSILDENGNELTAGTPPFIIERVGVPYDNFRIKTNQLFWYGAPTGTKSNIWTLSFQTSYSSGTYIDNLNNVITITLQNVAPDTLVFTSTDATTYTTGQTVTTSFDINSTSFGTFTGKNGTADTPNNQEELCWTLSLTSAPALSSAVWSIDQSGVISKTGTLANGTYVLKATLTDAASSCITSTNSLSTDCTISIVIGTPDTDRAICFQEVSSWFAANDTSCFSASGYPLEMFFGSSQYVANATSTATTGSKSDAYLGTLVGTNYTSYSGSGLNLRYYNVKARALAAYTCLGVTPAFTTGGLTQGVLAIKAVFSKGVTAGVADFSTQYTILWRASAADAWQLASPCSSCGGDATVNSPTNPGGTVGSFNTMTVTGAGSATASTTYYFDNPGEYLLRNNYVGGPGCTSYGSAASFTGEFWDVTTGTTLNPCTDCTGPL